MFRKKKKKKFQLTLHLSTLINSTCFPPKGVVEAKLGIPTSSRTSASFAPPQMAESRYTLESTEGIRTQKPQ